jgi:hypothetical protein
MESLPRGLYYIGNVYTNINVDEFFINKKTFSLPPNDYNGSNNITYILKSGELCIVSYNDIKTFYDIKSFLNIKLTYIEKLYLYNNIDCVLMFSEEKNKNKLVPLSKLNYYLCKGYITFASMYYFDCPIKCYKTKNQIEFRSNKKVSIYL